MWRRLLGLLLMVVLTAGTIASCAEMPRSTEQDFYQQQYQEYELRKAIQQQSG